MQQKMPATRRYCAEQRESGTKLSHLTVKVEKEPFTAKQLNLNQVKKIRFILACKTINNTDNPGNTRRAN